MKVDGVDYVIDWRRFKVGCSFFLPCIHADKGREQIRLGVKRFQFKIAMRLVVEDGVRGIRVWRLK
jgi:hypothetical protein